MLFYNVRNTIPLLKLFRFTLIVASSILLYLVLKFVVKSQLMANIIILFGVSIGSFSLIKDTVTSILQRNFALDYIAILAIFIGLFSGNFLVAAVIVLMLSGGETLEKYGIEKAKNALSRLKNRIPDKVLLNDRKTEVKLSNVKIGEEIYIRKGEVIPLDGILKESAFVDQSSLTGEPYEIELKTGDIIRSGVINIGSPIAIKVTAIDKDSTYRKIIQLVQKAQQDKSPFIRLADKYSAVFTIITLFIAVLTFIVSHDMNRVLAVLVIATPCPLILATPIALMGGVSSSARKRIIIKKLSFLEGLSRINFLVFDKTGTITLGKPQVSDIVVVDNTYTQDDILQIADAIERSSLHPLAKAITLFAREKGLQNYSASDIHEILGTGISGVVNSSTYTLTKRIDDERMSIALTERDKELGYIYFNDIVKKDAKEIFDKIAQMDIDIEIFTGDKKSVVEKLLRSMNLNFKFRANCSPEDKLNGINEIKGKGYCVGMVGDGLNDAAALAASDIGLVFAQDDQTATTEAADVILLGGDLNSVLDALIVSKKTINIALQSILLGIGLSLTGMVFASFGVIPPIIGAFIQEIIDVGVILNAIRASRIE